MIYPLDQVAQQVNKTDQQLIYHLILEQQETNRLLRKLIEGQSEETDGDSLKRPELMKRMAKLPNKPQGWNKWSNEEIMQYLKEAG